jgi:peptidoglycan/xylan/chitin deacetylase (PgdA/CDA1 family)
MQEKYAVITLDVEDWYHTGYLHDQTCDRSFSILDTVDEFTKLVEAYGGHATLFVLGQLIAPLSGKLNRLAERGHEIASHGWSHTPPLKLGMDEFKKELEMCARAHRESLSAPLLGFRGPLFSMDRARLDEVREAGFAYDSSTTWSGRGRPHVDLSGFRAVQDGIDRSGDFFEFRATVSGLPSVFVGGGGATRILPWPLSERILRSTLRKVNYFSFYTHPVDLSPAELPLPGGLSWAKRARMLTGRKGMKSKLEMMLAHLRGSGFRMVTFNELREKYAPSRAAEPA